MESYVLLILDFVQIIAEAYKIFLKNGKLMSFITLLIISFHSVLYLFNFFSVKPLIIDLIVKQTFLFLTSPNSPEFANLIISIHKDIKTFVGVEWIFMLIGSIASLFFAIATTYASAAIHGGKELSIQDLVLKSIRSWKRPFVTCFYVALLGIGYVFLCVVVLLPILLIVSRQDTFSVLAILLSVPPVIFYTYIAVVWNLSLVISVLEEKSGIEALGKAAQIVKGKKLQGFLLNLLLIVLSLTMFQGFRFMIKLKQSTVMQIIVALLVSNSMFLVRMFGNMAYTVMYYQCKNTRGEEVELEGSIGYTKIPTGRNATDKQKYSLIEKEVPV